MYYPYGGAQQAQAQPQPQGHSSTLDPVRGGVLPQQPSSNQYYDPYAQGGGAYYGYGSSSTLPAQPPLSGNNASPQGYENYYTYPDQQQQQQQQQQQPPAPTHPSMSYQPNISAPLPQQQYPPQKEDYKYPPGPQAQPQQQQYHYQSQPQPQPQQQQSHQQQQSVQQYSAPTAPYGGTTANLSGATPSSPIAKCARAPPNRKVDLKNAPNPGKDLPQRPPETDYHTTGSHMPLSSGGFVGIDDGNANPKFFRPTTTSAPAEERLAKDSRVPFGAVLAPLCRPLHNVEEVPLVEDREPVRCQRCRGYISCHAQFTNMGRHWQCPLCTMTNTVEDNYFCNLDARNNRLDRAEKPELCRGSVEYDVTPYTEYALRDEKNSPIAVRPLHYLFLIDVSQKAATTFLSDYVDALLHSLHEMAQQYPQCRVAFITYASTIQFYNVRNPRIPQLIVADIDNPFVPLPFTSFCWLTIGTELDLVDAFLMRVPEFAEDLKETECALGAAVQVAMLVLSGQHGGRVIVSAHKAPRCGIGALKLREQHLLYGTDREKELLRPLDGFWKTTAESCAKQQISFDLHMFADEYCELVTLSQICRLSNGRVHLFADYDRGTDATRVQAALDQALLEEAGYAGILRVRCSTGLRVQSYHGNFLMQDPHDMDLAHIQGSSTFFVDFTHEGKLEKNTYVYFQVALLYTTRAGQRRVRIHSARMPVVTTYSTLFAECDLEATLIGYIHEAASGAVNKGLAHARSAMQERVEKMLITYRRFCTTENNSSTLLMPSRLRLIPIYTLCMMKSDALMEGTTVRIDERVQKLFYLMTIPMHHCLTYLYPTLYAVHHLSSDATLGVLDPTTGRCTLPVRRQLICDSISSSGVYILCDEQARLVYLWIGCSVSPQVSFDLFGTENPAEVGHTVLMENFADQLRNILCACLMRDDGMRRLVILHEKDRMEEAFFKQLKEEYISGGAKSYDEFLVAIHRGVSKALS